CAREAVVDWYFDVW
nr:immunoglobulin heavy chain junction region [Mus musculus]MBK4188049.1 immunoglobulin heavy chain junction region [Mus musculus]